jgi:hypothetical protein
MIERRQELDTIEKLLKRYIYQKEKSNHGIVEIEHQRLSGQAYKN